MLSAKKAHKISETNCNKLLRGMKRSKFAEYEKAQLKEVYDLIESGIENGYFTVTYFEQLYPNVKNKLMIKGYAIEEIFENSENNFIRVYKGTIISW